MKKFVLMCMCLVVAVSGGLFAAGEQEAGAVIEYSVATSMVAEDAIPTAIDMMIAEIDENSNGRMSGTSYHNTQLGSQRDYIDGMQMGSMQMAESSTSLLAGISEKFAIFDMPYISRDMNHCLSVLNSGLGDILSRDLEEKAKLKVIGWAVRTPRSVYSSKGPIETIDDFKGLKIRTMETKAVMRAMELLNAKPVPIPGTERYMALQTKVVDAAENSSAEILVKKEYEVTDYLSKTEHLIVPNPILVSLDFFNSLDADLQEIVLDAGKKAGEYATQLEIERLADVEKQLAEKGMMINEINDKSDFVSAMAPLYKEYESKIGKEIFESFLK